VIQVKNLDFKKIIATDLWLLRNDKEKQFKKKNISFLFLVYFFLRVIYRSFLSSPKIKIKDKENLEIFYIRTNSRSDLNKHSEYYENTNNTSVCILSEKKKKIDLFNFFKIIFFLFQGYKFWKKGLKNNNLNLFSVDGFYIFLKFLESLSDIFKIIPLFKKHKKLVCFQENLPTENFLCQYANDSNIETYSLQHALAIYKADGSFESRFPICNYINLTSKNIMCWGKHNETIYKKHSSSKVYVIGKPYLPKLSSDIFGVTFIFENKEFKETNERMLKLSNIFENNKIQVSRWFKPSHSLSSSGIVREGPLRKIIIGCNSTFVVELGFLGFQVFVTQDSNLIKYLPKELIINDKDFFIDKKNILENYPKQIWKNFIDCSDVESLSRYEKIMQ